MDRPGRRMGHPPGLPTPGLQSLSISWPHVSIAFLGLIVVVIALAIILLYLAYGMDKKPPRTLRFDHISQEAKMLWYENGAVSIEASDPTSVAAALGFAHAARFPWQMTLWRQTANGDLMRWFGPNQLGLDRLSRQLRFSSLARATFEALPPEQKAWLTAYAEGVNAAFTEKRLLIQDDLALLGKIPEPWQPWDALTLERLFAWLSIDLEATPDTLGFHDDETWRMLVKEDRTLRNWLHLHHFEYSLAGVLRSGGERPLLTVFDRIVYGDAATPLFQEIEVSLPDRSPVFVSSIPGTFLFLTGYAPSFQWSILPTGTLTPHVQPITEKPLVVFDRMMNRDGAEFLAKFDHYPGKLVLDAPADSSEPALTVNWNGLLPGTDLESFMQLLYRQVAPLQLIDGDGLLVEGGSWRLLGDPDTSYAIDDGVLIGKSPWISYLAAHLDSLARTDPTAAIPEAWPVDCFNRWAVDQVADLLASLPIDQTFDKIVYQDAFTYLRNWDYTYDASSIGASIFERWLSHLSPIIEPGSVISPPPGQSIDAFKAAVDELVENYGTDLSRWRLEVTRPGYRNFAAWSADSTFLGAEEPLSKSRFAPLSYPGKGHAAALCWGAFTTSDGYMLSSRWDSWSRANGEDFTVSWRRNVVPESFLERYLIANRPGGSFSLRPDEPIAFTTRILPRS